MHANALSDGFLPEFTGRFKKNNPLWPKRMPWAQLQEEVKQLSQMQRMPRALPFMQLPKVQRSDILLAFFQSLKGVCEAKRMIDRVVWWVCEDFVWNQDVRNKPGRWTLGCCENPLWASGWHRQGCHQNGCIAPVHCSRVWTRRGTCMLKLMAKHHYWGGWRVSVITQEKSHQRVGMARCFLPFFLGPVATLMDRIHWIYILWQDTGCIRLDYRSSLQVVGFDLRPIKSIQGFPPVNRFKEPVIDIHHPPKVWYQSSMNHRKMSEMFI